MGELIDKRVLPRSVRINAEVVELDIVQKRLDAKVEAFDTEKGGGGETATPEAAQRIEDGTGRRGSTPTPSMELLNETGRTGLRHFES